MKTRLALLMAVISLAVLPILSSSQQTPVSVKDIELADPFPPVVCNLKTVFGDTAFKWHLENNSTEAVTVILSTEILGWSHKATKTITLNPERKATIGQFPSCKDKFMQNREVKSVDTRFVMKHQDKVIYDQTKTIKVLPRGDMLWRDDDGSDLTILIAGWVTPHDPVINKVLSLAKERMSDRSFFGYQITDQKRQIIRTYHETRAIYTTLREDLGISYVNTPTSFSPGASQRVRLPRESIEEKSANCIDGTVLLASCLEALGYEVSIMLVPQHAFLSVRGAPGSNQYVFVETTVMGQNNFETSVKRGNRNYQKALKTGYKEVNINDCRRLGINPMSFN